MYSDNSTPALSFTYTLTGKLVSVTDAAGTRTFTYKVADGGKATWTDAKRKPLG